MVTTRTWNALRRYEHFYNGDIPLTREQLTDVKFLKTIRDVGKKTVKEIVENVEVYLK